MGGAVGAGPGVVAVGAIVVAAAPGGVVALLLAAGGVDVALLPGAPAAAVGPVVAPETAVDPAPSAAGDP